MHSAEMLELYPIYSFKSCMIINLFMYFILITNLNNSCCVIKGFNVMCRIKQGMKVLIALKGGKFEYLKFMPIKGLTIPCEVKNSSL